MYQQQLDPLLNTEVTPQQLRKIDPTLYYLLKITKRSTNNRVTHGILLAYNPSEVCIYSDFYKRGIDIKSPGFYTVKPTENLQIITGKDCAAYKLRYGDK